MSMHGMSGFDGLGTAPGEVYGLRWWRLNRERINVTSIQDRAMAYVDGQLLLTGAHGGSWQPGENHAACQRDMYGTMSRFSTHPVPDEDCGCGFWGYWNMADAPIPSGERVVGVIKGYGTTLIGSKGFRSARASIQALCLENPVQRDVPITVKAYKLGPVRGVRWQSSGLAATTYAALGGSPASLEIIEDDTAPASRKEVDLDATSALEQMLSDMFMVPVYTDPRAMLVLHPTTQDYAEKPAPEPTDEDLRRVQQMLKDTGAQLAQAVKDALMPQILTGAQALEQLRKRIEDQP